MDRFPSLQLGGGARWLPLAEHVAAVLIEALLEVDQPQRSARLADQMRRDPALLLWSVLRAGRWQAAPPRDVNEVADWLAAHLLDVFAWPAEAPNARAPGADAGGRASAARFARLAAERVARAFVARQGERGEPACLFALLADAEEWFVGVEEAAASLPGGESFLPAWLAALRVEEESATPDGEAREAGKEVERNWRSAPLGGRGGLALRRLAERLRRLRELEQDFAAALEREKLDSLKELAYGASHEINNPLANISTRAQTLLRDETDPERRKQLATINSQAFRAHEMIADMMLFARPPRLAREPVDLAEVVADVLAEFRAVADAQGTKLAACADNGQTGPLVNADGTQLRVALHALVRNALEAVGGGGRVEITIEAAPHQNGNAGAPCVRLVVFDTGPGISAEVRRHLFDPFYSGREAGRGLGFGLSKCWRIITAHGGRIDVQSEPGRGATFVVSLPCEAARQISRQLI
jgi:signal transduction histidine kinase